MDFGGAYYQSPIRAEIAGAIDPNSVVKFDGNGAAIPVWTVAGGDNIVVENIWLTNVDTSSQNLLWDVTGTPGTIRFTNCRFTDTRQNKTDIAGLNLIYESCYVDTVHNGLPLIDCSAFVFNCVVKSGNKGFMLNSGAGAGGTCILLNNLILDGVTGVFINASDRQVVIVNNTIYNQSGQSVEVSSSTEDSVSDIFNNIMVPQASAKAININSSGGSVRNDYNCIWGMDGNQLTTPFATAYSGGTVPVLGPHSIEQAPEFVDAASSDFRPRNPAVLRGGMGDIANVPRSMGAVLQQYQFANRARAANLARLGIIR